MTQPDPLSIPYRTHDPVRLLQATIRYCLEGIALEARDDGESAGAYLAIITGNSVAETADPMGDNRWPDRGRNVLDDVDAFYDAATSVARSCDGAAVVAVDGIVNEQLVRFRSPGGLDVEYEPWMGARHMSALDVSTREDVIATLTLSAETGRVSVFEDGRFESDAPAEFGDRWRCE